MTLKTNWVSDPEIRNTLSFLDIGVLTMMVLFNMSLIMYCIYLDSSVYYRYISYRLAGTYCCKKLKRLNKWISTLFFNNT